MTSPTEALLRRLRNALISTFLRLLTLFSSRIWSLLRRLRSSPGLPVPNPTESYWQTPRAPIASHGEQGELSEYADVVIIGSGITGTAVARTLLDWERDHGRSTRVLMLEAREACSGATGRNGGHITPILYAQYPSLLRSYGSALAKQIIRFRLSHLPTLLSVASAEGLLASSQARQVDAWDVFLNEQLWRDATQMLAVYEREIDQDEPWKILHGLDATTHLGLTDTTKGCLGTKAGAIHPYRFVTGILQRLLREYSSLCVSLFLPPPPTNTLLFCRFTLHTHTPCTSISTHQGLYTVSTPRGRITTRHVVHATNGWVSHLLPGMRGRIVPARGIMTAQPRPPEASADANTDGTTWNPHCAFVFFPGDTWNEDDYLTQQALPPQSSSSSPSSSYPPPQGELMLGGGFSSAHGYTNVLEEIGNANDAGWNADTGAYLSTALGRYFPGFDAQTQAETKEDTVPNEKQASASAVKSLWSGILGISVDGQPWVGRVPPQVSGRPSPPPPPILTPAPEPEPRASHLAPPGEWLSAGYSGEGMVHAWLSGKALAYMVLGLDVAALSSSSPSAGSEPAGMGVAHTDTGTDPSDPDTDLAKWFPSIYRITPSRWASTGIEDLVAAFI
ncbi:hypothetical protein H0H87_001518 [Tephrocybe sp. NHM501043]|nr:hypothetical protein H0H87_001518 [Tephrocybe sp. NHM501043]